MAIAPLQIPGYAAPQSLDFSPLANLGTQYKQAQQDAVRQQTLAQLGQGNGQIDPRALLASGDMSLANLGISIQNRQQDQERQARQDQRQTSRDSVDDRFRQESLSLQKSAAARAADKTPTNFVADASVPGGYRPIGPADPDYQALLARKKAEAEASVPGAGGASLNPVYGVVDGKPAMIQTTKTGKAIQTELPAGFQISKEPIKVDNGTYYTLIDPQTRQPVGTLPKNLEAVERAKVVGDATGQAEVALPQVLANGNHILKTLTDIENHPGKNSSLGIYSALPIIPGTERANFRASMEQLQGQNFLQAYQTLRGGGAITDIEGKKGENAQARMQTAQTQESFDAALKDFKDVVKAGMLRSAAKARGAGAPAGQPQGASNTTQSGIQWSIQ